MSEMGLKENNPKANKRSKKWKYVLSILFMITLFIVTFVTIFKKYDFQEVLNVMKETNYLYVGIGIVMIFVYILFEGAAMKVILKSLGIKSTLYDNFVYSAIDYYFCAITPSATGGQPMVAYYMSKDKISLSHVSLTLLLNTALFKIVLLILSIVSLIACPGFVGSSPLLIGLYIFGFSFNVFLILLCLLCAFRKNWVEYVGKRMIMFFARIGWCKKPLHWMRIFKAKMDEYEEGARLIKQHKGRFMLAFLFNLIQRTALFSISYLVYLALLKNHPALEGFNYIQLLSIQVIVALCVDSLPLPGGVGISEYLYICLFGLIYGADGMVASAMLLTRAINFYIPLIITGLISFGRQIRILIRRR